MAEDHHRLHPPQPASPDSLPIASRLSTGSLVLLLPLRHRALSLLEGPVCLSRPPGVTKRPATQLSDPL